MATLRANSNPTSRIETGEALLSAAQTLEVAPIKGRLGGFEKAHKSYVAAEAKVRAAEGKLREQQARVGELDVDQDELVDQLAAGAAGDGLLRANPFKPLGFAAPSKIKIMSFDEEPKVAIKLAAAVGKRKDLSAGTKATATRLAKAAAAVQKASEPLGGLVKARLAAITQRDALAMPWEKSFAALKNAARAADDDGAAGLFEALFQRTVRPVAGKKPSKPKKPAPSSTPPAAASG